MGETPTLLELLAGFADAAVEHGVDAAGVFSSAVKVLAPAAVAAVWVAMTPRCSFLTSMVGISLIVFSVQVRARLGGGEVEVAGGADGWVGEGFAFVQPVGDFVADDGAEI